MNRSFNYLSRKQSKWASFLGKASIYLSLVASLYYPTLGYSADEWPPNISRDYVKGIFHGMFIERFSNAPTKIQDAALKSRFITCMLPAINDAVDKSFPVGVNSLDAATFKLRIDPIKIADIAIGESEKCTKTLMQRIEQSKQASSANQIPLMDLDDLRTDMASLQGRKVRVKAIGHYMMNMFMLKKTVTDTSPIFIDISKLNRDQRLRVLQQCNDFVIGCRVTIYGTVENVNYEMGISAENIEFQ